MVGCITSLKCSETALELSVEQTNDWYPSVDVYCCKKIVVVVRRKLISFSEMWAPLDSSCSTKMDELQFKDSSHSIKNEHCQDFWNLSVPSGQHYIPGADPCILCLCENGKKFYCQAVRCAASEVYKTFFFIILLLLINFIGRISMCKKGSWKQLHHLTLNATSKGART